MAMDALETIRTRRSIRSYTAEPVPPEKVDTLLRAAMAAPSANNQRPWRFVIVRDRATLARLAEATPWATPLRQAPVGIVVFADTSANLFNADLAIVDCGLAAQNLMLAARAEGLGTVWLAAWPYPAHMKHISAILKSPAHAVPVAMFAVGVPENEPGPVDRFEPGWVYSEQYGAR
jgi:nitroreductase